MPGRLSRARPCRTAEMLFRRCRKRNRLVGQRGQIGDHVGALGVLLDAGKAHRGAGNEALRIGDELVEVVERPFAALALHGGGEVEASLALALLLADGAVQVRTDAVGAALFEGVASGALLGGGSAALRGSGLQQLFDRLGRRGRGFLASAMRLFLHGDLEARLFRNPRRENRTGGKTRHQKQNAGAEDGTEDLVEFEGVHCGSGSSPEGRRKAGKRPRIASGIRLSRCTLSRVEISVCPASGNPYKRPDFPPIPTISRLFSRPPLT